MNRGTQSTIVYVIIGIIMGYASTLVNNYIALVLAVVFLFLIAEILKRVWKMNEKFKWFWSNGGWLYIFVWFIVWIIFYNL
jgi:dolichol kinase